MRNLITTSVLALVASFLSAQECAVLNSHVKTMGLQTRVDIDLDAIEPVTIPVVFHIIYSPIAENSNISDEQVMSQIPALDSGFRYTGVDTKIQFCLASRDPDGNPTNGITRHNGVDIFGQTFAEFGVASTIIEDGVNDLTLKQTVGCWNPDEYLNFYIVPEINGNNGGGGIQGYAYLGATNDCRDGIVQLDNVTGTVGSLKYGHQKGYTGVHEAGHYLNLQHTFNNTYDCGSETNCETQGDYVCDTPPTKLGNFCTSPICDGAMVENFMDYTSEQCKESFTVGQAERMHACIQSERQDLINNLSCVAPVDYDVHLDQVYYDQNWCTATQDISVTIYNTGGFALSSTDVQLVCNGQTYTQTVYDLDPGAGVSVIIQDVYVDGANSFEINVLNDLDEYTDNNYGVYPIQDTGGQLLEVSVHLGFFASENSWDIQDENGNVVISEDNYNAGCDQQYTYQACVDPGCYTFNFYDIAGNGVQYCGGSQVVTLDGQTLAVIPELSQGYTVTEAFCIEQVTCEYDYDGNGSIGNGDVLTIITNYGCQGECEYDTNADGIVNVLDILYILTLIGDCPVEPEANLILKDLTVPDEGGASSVDDGAGITIYDLSGRIVSKPIYSLATGIYIVKTSKGVQKIFVQ